MNIQAAPTIQEIAKYLFDTFMVRFPDWNKTFFLNTDASNIDIVVTLLQDHEINSYHLHIFLNHSNPQRKYTLHLNMN